MTSEPTRELSILACVTGLLLAAIFFVAMYVGTDTPDWLPMMISAIGGFELFLFAQGIWARRAGGR